MTTAANGAEGLAAVEMGSYDVILCDMRMPHLDGPGFYRELERRHPHLVSRVIFLTGDVLSPEVEAFFARVTCPRLKSRSELRRCDRSSSRYSRGRPCANHGTIRRKVDIRYC